MRKAAHLALALAVVGTLGACGSSGRGNSTQAWLHRLASKQARVYSQGHASRVSRVKLTVGTHDTIELWGQFDCNGTNCVLGSCDGIRGREAHPDGTCGITFRYIKLGVDPITHRLGLVKKLSGAKAAWVATRPSAHARS